MPSLSVNTALLNFLISIGACLSIATVVFLFKAVIKREWGSAAMASAMLLIAVFGWIFSLQEGYLSTPAGNPDLQIIDQIETTGGGSLYLTWVTVLNRGTGTAKNCVVEIEHRTLEEREYKYLGYALLQREIFTPHTESRFWLVRARSYDEGAHWETSIMLRDIRDYVEQESNVINHLIVAGDHYLKLTTIAENGESPAREFKLNVPRDKAKLPTLEALPQAEAQAEQ